MVCGEAANHCAACPSQSLQAVAIVYVSIFPHAPLTGNTQVSYLYRREWRRLTLLLGVDCLLDL